MTPRQFALAVGCPYGRAEVWAHEIDAAIDEFRIGRSPRHVAAFLAQMAHESDNFSRFEERLSYSPERLMAVWPRRFPTRESTQGYAWQPEALANHVYANRMGNGAPASGDGYKYRGRGPKQITGASNYRRCGVALNLPLIERPELLLIPRYGARSAAWYWEDAGCNDLMDRDDYAGCTRAINGGMTGHEDGNDDGDDDRVERYARALGVMETQA